MAESQVGWLVIAFTIGAAVIGTIYRKWFRSFATKEDIENALAQIKADLRATAIRNARIEMQLRRLNDTLCDMAPPHPWVPPDG